MVGVRISGCTAAASELEDCCMMYDNTSTVVVCDTVSESREPVLPEQQSMTLLGSACSGDGNWKYDKNVSVAVGYIYTCIGFYVLLCSPREEGFNFELEDGLGGEG